MYSELNNLFIQKANDKVKHHPVQLSVDFIKKIFMKVEILPSKILRFN